MAIGSPVGALLSMAGAQPASSAARLLGTLLPVRSGLAELSGALPMPDRLAELSHPSSSADASCGGQLRAAAGPPGHVERGGHRLQRARHRTRRRAQNPFQRFEMRLDEHQPPRPRR